MRKIVTFKKELLFKTKVSEITSISLEHKVLSKDDGLVSGEFLINGEYKMTEGSINREKYEFTLPFDIAINSNYDIDTVKVDIDNFYYEVLNNDTLNVNIDLLLEASEKELVRAMPEETERIEKIDILENREEKENELEEMRKPIMNNPKIENEVEDFGEVDKINNVIIEDNSKKEEVANNININNNIFNVDSGETYSTYYVYIVKENDTIDKILDKYGITKEDLELYNNLENIKPFDKIIIPTNGR